MKPIGHQPQIGFPFGLGSCVCRYPSLNSAIESFLIFGYLKVDSFVPFSRFWIQLSGASPIVFVELG
ncbi:hypothetical protein VNO78_14863 [Psophocarpus tetragonolobus]|uniref:Uncharacterized protein n=1 Tax=Psophocarpus tetragonolobus TaxID=3891 RepID=A0AAN9SE03_PSOTE